MPLSPDMRADVSRPLPTPVAMNQTKRVPVKPHPSAVASPTSLLPLSPPRSLHGNSAKKMTAKDMPQPSPVLLASRSPPMSPHAQENDKSALENFALRVYRQQHRVDHAVKALRAQGDVALLVALPKKKRAIVAIPKLKNANTTDHRRRQRHRNADKSADDNSGRLNAGVYVLENVSTGHKYFGTTWDLKNAAAQSFVDLRDAVHPHQALVESYATDTNSVKFRVLERVVPPPKPTPTDRQQTDADFAVRTLESLLAQRVAVHTRQLFRKLALRLVRRRLIRPRLVMYWLRWKQNALELPVALEQLASAVAIQSLVRMFLTRQRILRQRRHLAALRIARFFALCAFKRVLIKRCQRQLRHATASRLQQFALAFLQRRRREKRQRAVRKCLCARRIQRVFRGHLGRRQVRLLFHERRQDQAATHLQRLTRGFFCRHQYHHLLHRQLLDANAARIQAALRGYFTRTVLVPSLQQSKRRLGAVRVLQRFYRRVVVQHKLSAAAETLRIQRQHANRIHAAYKNYLASKFGWAAMTYKTEHANAVVIQRCLCRWFFFSRIRRLAIANTQFQAALRIQRIVRGHHARQDVQRRRKIQRDTTAATKIQRCWRLYKGFTRLRLALWAWRCDCCARRIQAAVRGHRARRVYRIFRDQTRRERAATKLQTIFRAARARKEWRRRAELRQSGRACVECGEREAEAFLSRAELELCVVCLRKWGPSAADDDVVPLLLHRRQQQLAFRTQRVFRWFQSRMKRRFGVCPLCEHHAVRVACRSCVSGSPASFYCHSCDALLHKPLIQAKHHDRVRIELFHRQEEAAVRIQSHVRRFLQRRTLAQLLYAKQTTASAKIQTIVRRRQRRRRTQAMVDARRQLELKRYAAAVQIQRTARRWRRRRALAERIQRRKSAVVIQRVARGRGGRKTAMEERRRREAAVCIQRYVRGVRGRMIAFKRRTEFMERRRWQAERTIQKNVHRWIINKKRRKAAAGVIQRAWRSCSACMELDRLRRVREERLRLEALAREELLRLEALAREELARWMEEQRRHKAVTKIQGRVRTRQARNRLALLRVARATLLRAEQLSIWLAVERRAAVRIQRFVRSKWLKKAVYASGVLQRGARGFLARRELKWRRERRRAAVTIQRAFRYARVKRKLTQLVRLESFVATRAEGTGGWVELLDEESGCVYYYNRETMESSWVKPAEWVGEDVGSAAARSSGAAGEELPPEELQVPEWIEYWDENVGAAYYYNTLTGEATWAPPAGASTSSNQSESEGGGGGGGGRGGGGHYVWPPGVPVDKVAFDKDKQASSESSNQQEEAVDPAAFYYDDQGNAYVYYEGYGYSPYSYADGGGGGGGGTAAYGYHEGFDQTPVDTSYDINYEIFLTQQQQQQRDEHEQGGEGGGGQGPGETRFN